jgi:hypothetical protein
VTDPAVLFAVVSDYLGKKSGVDLGCQLAVE